MKRSKGIARVHVCLIATIGALGTLSTLLAGTTRLVSAQVATPNWSFTSTATRPCKQIARRTSQKRYSKTDSCR